MPKFLSDEWVEQARSIQAEYEGKGTPPPVKTKINLTISDVPDDVNGGEDIAANMDTTSGTLLLDTGIADDAEATIGVDYDLAKSFLVEGNQQVMMQAFMSGKVKISGDMSKVLALQAAGPDATAVEVQTRLREITD